MNVENYQTQKCSVDSKIRTLFIAVVVLGILLRFAHLDRKAFNWDEVRSFYRLSGYTREAVIEELFTGEIVSTRDIQRYQAPSSAKSFRDAMGALANNPEHPPLYYLIARFWMSFFGSPFSARVLSILLGIACLPALYWLCCELFHLSLAAWIALALFAVSPYQILLSQAAREYSLWTLMTLLSSAMLLKALRTQKSLHWLFYALTVTGGLYTHLFFAITAFSQGIYTAIDQQFRLTKNSIRYLASSGIAGLLFLPWLSNLWVKRKRFEEVTSWTKEFESGTKKIVEGNINNIGDIFLDFNNRTRIEYYISILLCLLAIYAIYCVTRSPSVKSRFFLTLLILPSWLIIFIPDLIAGVGVRSLQSRYLVPPYMGIQICCAFLLAQGIISSKHFMKVGASGLLVILILFGLGSGAAISQYRDWDYLEWQGTPISENLKIAPLINQSQHPLVISEATHSFILALSYLTDERVRFKLFKEQDSDRPQDRLNYVELSDRFSDIFIYYPRKQFLQRLKTERPNFEFRKVTKGLYKVTKYP